MTPGTSGDGAAEPAAASGPPVLVVTSSSSPVDAVVPVLAALEAGGAAVRTLDVGRLGSRSERLAQRVLRAIAAEVSGRRLGRELDEQAPAVAVAFDPASATALSELRGERRFAVAAVVAELDPEADWSEAVADRFLALDEHAATALQRHGVDGDRVVPVGPIASARFAAAALEDPTALRERFRIRADEPVVIVEVAGLGYEGAGSLALQLSLGSLRATYLFSAGDDAEAAAALRARVPTLGLRAKLFGATADAPLYYRAADVLVGPPRLATAMTALAVGARVVVLGEAGEAGRRIGAAIEARGLGRRADSALLIGAALEPLCAPRSRPPALDGAATAADAIALMARDAALIAGESAAARPSRPRDEPASSGPGPRTASGASARAGDLEDLGGDDGDAAPPASGTGRASEPAAGAPSRAARSSPPPRRPSGRSVDDELADLKRKGGGAASGPAAGSSSRPAGATRARASAPSGAGVDDELEALKRKMAASRKKNP